MLTKGDFMIGIHILQDNYGRQMTGSQLKLFYENLKDLDKDTYISNINNHIKTNSFMPTIAQLRNIPKLSYSNYEQREYTEAELNKFYAN